MKRRFLTYLSILLLLGMTTKLMAQSEPESSTLVIESQDGQQHHVLHSGDRLNYQVIGGRMQRKGKIESIQDSSLTVSGKEIAFKDLDILVQIKGKLRPVGAGLLIGSAIAEPISLLLYVVSLLALLDNPTSAQRVLIGLLGVFTLILLPLALIAGIVLVVIGTRRFDMRSGWRVHSSK